MAKEVSLSQAQQAKLDEFVNEKAAMGQAANFDVSKAYVAGHETNPAEQRNGGALRTEFLDTEMTRLTWSMADLQLYREVPRKASESTVAQYTVFTRHGDVGPSRFTTERGIAEVNDPQVRKKAVNMKYVSDTKQQTIASQLVNSIEDQRLFLTREATEVVAKSIEWGMFYGDGDLSDNPNPDSGNEFNGLVKLIAPENHIDLKGKPLTERALNAAAVAVGRGYGRPTHAFMPIGVHSEFVNSQLGRQTQLMQSNTGSVASGFNIDSFYSTRGQIRLYGSTVMDIHNILDERLPIRPNAPLTPTVEAKVNTGDNGQFNKLETDISEHVYKVTATGQSGPSLPSEAVTAVVANEDDSVELSITLNGLYQQRPQFVSVYRQGKTTNEFFLIKRIPASQADDNGLITFVDRNERLPETADVFVGELSESVIHLFELLPMARVPLAQLDAQITFSVLWYGALALRAPKRWARLYNVSANNIGDLFGHSAVL